MKINKYKFFIIYFLILIKCNKIFYYSNILNEIKKNIDRELFLKNITQFYMKLRIQFLSKRNITYNENNLVTFQDKLNYLIIHESPEYKSLLVDKIKLHAYSKKVLGKDICVPILKIYDNINKINFEDLPNQFVLKLNHGSGMNIICKNKSKLNISETLKILEKWKNFNYGLNRTEFQYLYVKRKIFAEKYLSDNLINYKIFCINGHPKFIRVRKIKKNENIKITYHYNLNWELNNLESGLKGYIRDPNETIPKPKNLDLMIKYAKLLSQEFVFVRVDLYDVNNTVYLGELTFSPRNNQIYRENKEQSINMGKLVDLTKIKSYLFNK